MAPGAAWCADQPVYGPVPAWVKPAVIPAATATADADGGAGPGADARCRTSKNRYGQDGDAFYHEYAFKILAPQGLSVAGSISQNWNPDTETLYIHRLNIIRDGKVIDVLASGQKFVVLRRENQLEQAMLDGNLTATIQPEGLEVGDIVDVVVTLRKNDPTLKGYSGKPGRPGAFLAWSAASACARSGRTQKPIRWRMTDGLGQPRWSPTRGARPR